VDKREVEIVKENHAWEVYKSTISLF